MKILLTTSVASAWPYIQEMIEELERQGVNVKVFDINDLGRPPLLTRLAFRAPALRYQASVAALKHRLSLLPNDFDVINIHFAAPMFAELTQALKRHGKALVTSIWGSTQVTWCPKSAKQAPETRPT